MERPLVCAQELRARLIAESAQGWDSVPLELIDEIEHFEKEEIEVAAIYVQCSANARDLYRRYLEALPA